MNHFYLQTTLAIVSQELKPPHQSVRNSFCTLLYQETSTACSFGPAPSVFHLPSPFKVPTPLLHHIPHVYPKTPAKNTGQSANTLKVQIKLLCSASFFYNWGFRLSELSCLDSSLFEPLSSRGSFCPNSTSFFSHHFWCAEQHPNHGPDSEDLNAI